MHNRQLPLQTPAPYPPKGGGVTLTKWRVRFVIEAAGQPIGEHDVIVLATSSEHAVERARNDFYGRWATTADRERLPLRAIERCVQDLVPEEQVDGRVIWR